MAAADPGYRLIRPGAQLLAEGRGSGVCVIGHPEDLGCRDRELGGDAVSLPWANGHGHPALSRDPVISEEGTEAADRSPPDIDNKRRRQHPGQ
jgi:hypothetical protein